MPYIRKAVMEKILNLAATRFGHTNWSDLEREVWINDIDKPWDLPNQEPIVCKHFSCCRHLSPQEALYGHFCPDHQPAVVSCWDGDVPELVSY